MRQKQNRLLTLLVPLMIALFIAADARTAVAAHRCSLSTLDGDYLGNLTGTTATAGPVALQALVSFHGDGTATGVTTTLMTLTSGPITFTSTITYTLNSNCTGSLTVVRSTGQTTHYNMVVVDNGEEINLLQIDPGTVVTGVFKENK